MLHKRDLQRESFVVPYSHVHAAPVLQTGNSEQTSGSDFAGPPLPNGNNFSMCCGGVQVGRSPIYEFG